MTDPIGPGVFVAVVGASGVGKDALLSYARERSGALARFPRRAITRPPGPGEDHDPVSEDQFALARERGAFAVCWRAHGLCYAIPAAADAEVRDGRVVVVNVSRTVISELAARYRRLVVVRVTASEQVRAQRLGARRREPEPGIGQRMARPDPAPGHRVDALIDNDGPLAEAGAQLVRVISAAARRPKPRNPGLRRPNHSSLRKKPFILNARVFHRCGPVSPKPGEVASPSGRGGWSAGARKEAIDMADERQRRVRPARDQKGRQRLHQGWTMPPVTGWSPTPSPS